MEFRKLGKSDLTLSRIGFGCWAIGGHGYGTVNDETSARAVQCALDLGINFFDTADVYGFGHSERVLAKALGKKRHDVVIATKFGVNWDEKGNTFKDCSPKRVVEALEGSLRRLRIDCIPLYQVHWHDGKTPILDTIEALLTCRDQGKIKFIGCSNFSEGQLEDSNLYDQVISIQSEYSVTKRRNGALLQKCYQSFDMGVIIYGVLARGLFSGKYNSNSIFYENDTRSKDEEFRGRKLEKNLLKVNQLKEIARRYGKSPAQVAIRLALDQPFVTSGILGMKTIDQVKENAGAIGWTLDCHDREQIACF